MCVYVCMCVCVYKKEEKEEKRRPLLFSLSFFLSFFLHSPLGVLSGRRICAYSELPGHPFSRAYFKHSR